MPASAIVVGGGLAGLSAAHTLLQGGAHVTLLERNAFLGGNSTKATSGINGAPSRTQAKQGVVDDMFLEDMVRSAHGQKTGPMPPSYPIADMFVKNSSDAIDWLQDDFGLALDVVSRMGGHSNQRTHRTKSGGKFPGMEITSALMKRYEQMADKSDGTCDLLINGILKGLLQDANGRVCGVKYLNADEELVEIHADSVVLATGGYGAGGVVKDSLLHQTRPDLCHLPTTNGDHSQGEGIKVGLDVGAKAIGLMHVQVHPTGLVNPGDPDNSTKLLAAEALRGEGGLIIDCEGRRFCNDIGKRDYVTGSMWSHNKAPYRLLLNAKASSQMQWHCDHYKSRRVMKRFDDAAGVAKEMGIDVNVLKETLDKYNADAAKGDGHEDEFGKVYYHNAPFEMDEHYYLAQVTPVVHYTMGGLAISSKTECVDEATSCAIPGLYACGEVTGGVHGRNRLGGSGLAEAVILGRVAGQSALEYAATPRPVTAASGPGATTTITIPQANGADPITITTTSAGGQAEKVLGDLVDVPDWPEEVTTKTSGLTSGAAGLDGPKGSVAAAPKAEPARAPVGGPATDVAVVYGSFFMGDSKRDTADILAAFPEDCKLSVNKDGIEGNSFDFNNLKDTKYLVVCTSSMYGNPPKNFWEFYFHLKQASENPNKPLKGLQHAVYGNGDETYIDTYMNVPRMVDTLLERAGSRRFYARAETGEQFKPLEDDMIEAEVWAPGMWKAMMEATDPDAPAVAWDAAGKSQHHDDATDWDIEKLEKKFGRPETQSQFIASKL
jgi:flavocytochrome c